VVADSACGDNTVFRQGLTDRGLTYALAVSASTSLHPATTMKGSMFGPAPHRVINDLCSRPVDRRN
jgi:SRSO17 transposase